MTRGGIPPSLDRVTFQCRLVILFLCAAAAVVVVSVVLFATERADRPLLRDDEYRKQVLGADEERARKEKAEALLAARRHVLLSLNLSQVKDVAWVDLKQEGGDGRYEFEGRLAATDVEGRVHRLNYVAAVHLDEHNDWALDDIRVTE